MALIDMNDVEYPAPAAVAQPELTLGPEPELLNQAEFDSARRGKGGAHQKAAVDASLAEAHDLESEPGGDDGGVSSSNSCGRQVDGNFYHAYSARPPLRSTLQETHTWLLQGRSQSRRRRRRCKL